MKNNKTLITVLVFALAAWVVFFVLVWRFNGLTTLVSELSQEELIESRKGASVSRIKSALTDLEDTKVILDSYVVTEDTVVDFIQLIEGLAVDAGVDLDVNLVTFEEVTADENEKETVLSIEMVSGGNWENTFQFISLLENAPYSVRVQKVGLLLQEIQLEGGEGVVREWRGDYEIHVASNK